MNSLLAGATVAFARLRRPTALLGPTLALLFVVLAALLERRASVVGATDRALAGAVFGLALPLLCYASFASATGQNRLDGGVWELARHGGRRKACAVGLLAATAVWLAALGAGLALVAVGITRSVSDPKLVSDLLASAWIGLLAGCSYAGWFALGSTIGSRGGGRTVALLLDWILGSGTTALAAPWPRGHLRNLLGSEAVLSMPQWAALAALLLLSVGYAVAAVWRCPD